MAVCKTRNSSAVAVSSTTFFTWVFSSKNNRQTFRKKLCDPEIEFVFQGLNCSNGPKNISYTRNVSAPYFEIKSSGLTTLYLDLDIFSTSQPHTYLPPSRINSASSGTSFLDFLNASKSKMSFSTMFTSTCKAAT